MAEHSVTPLGAGARGRSSPSGELPTRSEQSPRVVVTRVLAVAIAYGLAARLGLEFPYTQHAASLVWPASGVALAAVLLWGPWMALGVIVGATIPSHAVGITLPLSLWYGVGNAFSPLFGAWLLKRVGRVDLDLGRPRDVLGFVLLGVVVGTLPGPCAGVSGLVLLDALPHSQIGSAWFSWWLGDAAGVLVVTPALVTWLSVGRRRSQMPWARKLEAAALVAALMGSTMVGFGDGFAWRYPAFLPFPFLIWAALRFGVKGATGGSLLVSGMAVWSTAHGSGPFSFGHVHVDLVLLWAFMGTVAVVTLLLSAALGERDSARRSLELSEERFRRAFEDAPIAMAMATPAGTFVTANKRMQAMLGYTEDELTRLTVDDITHPEDRGRSRAGLQRARDGVEERYGLEKRYVRRDGAVVWVNMSATLVRDADGLPYAFIGLMEDITARKAAEEERGRLQRRLALSQRLESIGQLAGGVAHDFNNLLLGILLYVDLGLEAADDRPKLVEALTEIQAAARRAAELTRQLLAFGRRQTIQPVALDLDQQIGGLLGMLRRLIPANIELEHTAPDEPCWVMVDPGQIEQVIVNLCVNARDAMPGGGALRIQTGSAVIGPGHATLAPGDYAKLTISDTGAGIPPELRERIFEPFFTTKEEGTGLGLAVIYGIVRQHGGSIDIRDEPGGGACFEVLLPAAARPVTVQPRSGLRRARGGNETVLVIDDEALPRRTLASALERAGYRVLQATDGVEGLELFERHAGEIALVIVDLIMPRMGGRDVFANIRELDPDAKVMLTTGYGGDTPGGVPKNAEVLHKPYGANEMLLRVRSLLDRRESA